MRGYFIFTSFKILQTHEVSKRTFYCNINCITLNKKCRVIE